MCEVRAREKWSAGRSGVARATRWDGLGGMYMCLGSPLGSLGLTLQRWLVVLYQPMEWRCRAYGRGSRRECRCRGRESGK